MATIKWKDLNEKWETFYHGAFLNIKSDLKNIILSINNAASAIRMRCRRDFNLSDIYDAAEGRINLELINDCSALPRAPHHHDSRYIPLIEEERDRAMAEEEAIWDYARSIKSCTCSGGGSSGGGGGGGGQEPEPQPEPLPEGPFLEYEDRTPRGDYCYQDNGEHYINNPFNANFNAPRDGNVHFDINLHWNWYECPDFMSDGPYFGPNNLNAVRVNKLEERPSPFGQFNPNSKTFYDTNPDAVLWGMLFSEGGISFGINLGFDNLQERMSEGCGGVVIERSRTEFYQWERNVSFDAPVHSGTNKFSLGINCARYAHLFINYMKVTATYI